MKLLLIIAIVIATFGCSKGSGPSSKTSSGSGSDSLLAKQIWVAKNAAGSTVDSVVTTCTYDGNRNLNGFEQTSIGSVNNVTSTTVLSYQLVLSANLPSSLTGSVEQTISAPLLKMSATTQISTTFSASGGHITGYIQVAKYSGSGPIPLDPQTGNDSAILTYDAGGNVATFTLYEQPESGPPYALESEQTFTYGGSNMTGSVNKFFVGGMLEDTFTGVYTYNSQQSPFPYYSLGSGLFINNVNDLTQVSQTETGTNPGQVITSYTTTYNSVKQPVTTTATLSVTPADAAGPATERISYYYQ